jgi:hypothetical protein
MSDNPETMKLSGEDLADWIEALDEAEEDQKLAEVLFAFLPAIVYALRRTDLEEELKLDGLDE